jgi:hypothetical protein
MHGPAYNSTGTQVMDIIDAHVIVQNDWYLMQDHGSSGPTSTINISGSSVVEILNSGGGLAFRGQDQGTTNINLLSTGNGDPCFVANGTIAGADGTNADLNLYMDGGYFEAGGLSFGDDGGGTCTIEGGTMILHGGLNMQSRAGNIPVQFILDGGAYVEVAGGFGCPTNDEGDAAGDIYLNSGTLICGSFDQAGFNWTLDIDDGVLWKIAGDRLSQIQNFINLGLITGRNGTTAPLVVFDGEYTRVGFDLVQKKAYQPVPTSGTSGICPENGITLSWTAGEKAERHEVFFGTDYAVVEAMSSPTALRALGSELYPTGWLEYGKNYYWRILEFQYSKW